MIVLRLNQFAQCKGVDALIGHLFRRKALFDGNGVKIQLGAVGAQEIALGLAAVGVVMSILSQVGDLLASVIKRTYGVKDYGKLFPGHGGVLDRFDSVLLLAPFLLALVEDAQFLQLIFRVAAQ